MAVRRQSARETLEEVASWRPALAPVLRAFTPLLTAQEALAEELRALPAVIGFALPPMTAERAQQGLALLSGADFTGVACALRASLDRLLPLLAALEALAPVRGALSAFGGTGQEGDERLEGLLAAVVGTDDVALRRLAEANGLAPDALGFVGLLVAAPVLRAVVRGVQPECPDNGAQAPWDANGGLWQHGYCPMCGALPSLAWLEKPLPDARNPCLLAGGGRKHLHCGLCGADWKFRRGACPACGAEGSKVLEILRESGVNHGERLDWCTRCRGYCPCVDLREREFVPNLEALPLGLVHLDMVAARRELRPLRPTFWNMP